MKLMSVLILNCMVSKGSTSMVRKLLLQSCSITMCINLVHFHFVLCYFSFKEYISLALVFTTNINAKIKKIASINCKCKISNTLWPTKA